MKLYRKKPTIPFVVFLILLIVPVLVYISIHLYQFITFDKERYVISTLEDRYNSDFICESKEEKGNDNTIVYYLKPSVRPDLIVSASYWEGWNREPMSAVPFNLDYRKEVTDDFFTQIIQETKEAYIQEPFELTSESIYEETNILLDLAEKVSEQKNKYVKPDYFPLVNDYFTVSVSYKETSGEISIHPDNQKYLIKNQIRNFIGL